MSAEIIRPNECVVCNFCCRFTDVNLWDVPLFTEGQKAMYPEISFQRYGMLWTPVLSKTQDYYICPFWEINSGCKHKIESKPFDCYWWPLCFMKKDSKIIITLYEDCQATKREQLLAMLRERPNMVLETCEVYPDYVREYQEGYEIVFEYRDKQLIPYKDGHNA